MAEAQKLRILQDLLSDPNDQTWIDKVIKDQIVPEDIPLSPQWLYTKPSEIKMDVRTPSSLSLGNVGNSIESSQKEVWRSDAAGEKKKWRRNLVETDTALPWREEERETGLLDRRDQKKTERPICRETTENKVLPSSERWNGVITNRSFGQDSIRRDGKWSSRRTPEDNTTKELLNEKKTDAEKDYAYTENESDSHDKWRPRHRIEGNSTGLGSYRVAPGFEEKGKIERGFKVGFSLGRGRSNGTSSLGTPGTLGFPMDTFIYPRGKLLDIYRMKNFMEPTFVTLPEGMEEAPPITGTTRLQPLSFVTPDKEEEAILDDVLKGKISGSGNDSFTKERSNGLTETSELESNILSSTLAEDNAKLVDITKGDASLCKDHNTLNNDFSSNEGLLTPPALGAIDIKASLPEILDSAFGGQCFPTDFVSAATAMNDNNANLLSENSNGLCLSPSVWGDNVLHPQKDVNASQYHFSGGLEPEEMKFYYLDPQGDIQGPFLGADIVSWYKQGFFRIDLLVRSEDAPIDSAFHELGQVMSHLIMDLPAESEQHRVLLDTKSGTEIGRESEPVDQHWHMSGLHPPRSRVPKKEEMMYPSYPNEIRKPGMDNGGDDTLLPCGLLLSELEGNYARRDQQQSDHVNNYRAGRASLLGTTLGSLGHISDTWPNISQESNLENLLALKQQQFQRELEAQLQQQHLQQLQQVREVHFQQQQQRQQRHKVQQIYKEDMQRKFLIEQLIQNRKEEFVREQILLKQQQSYLYPPPQVEPTLKQLIQAKLNQVPHQADLSELVSWQKFNHHAGGMNPNPLDIYHNHQHQHQQQRGLYDDTGLLQQPQRSSYGSPDLQMHSMERRWKEGNEQARLLLQQQMTREPELNPPPPHLRRLWMLAGVDDNNSSKTLHGGAAEIARKIEETEISSKNKKDNTTFSEMLRSSSNNTKKDGVAGRGSEVETVKGGGGGGGRKKKGKKGRQLDPSLLGFKVTSNRIMMGEIQRVDD